MDDNTTKLEENATPPGNPEHPGLSYQKTQHVWSDGSFKMVKRPLVREMPLTVYVNKSEVVTLLCTPSKLNCLVAGFLVFEEIAKGIDDILLMRVCSEETMAEVTLAHSDVKLPTRRTLTSGCGGGTVFSIDTLNLQRIASDTKVSVAAIQGLMRQLHERAVLYRIAGGVHTSALADAERLLIVAEDVGRHNTLDKIYGECLLMDIPSQGRILLTTGRVSSEMLIKAAKMKVPIVVSRTAPTDEAARLADELDVTLIGYAKGTRMSLYTHPWRIIDFEKDGCCQ